MSRADIQDYSDIASLQRQMIETSDEISSIADDVAKARQLREWDSERRKTALSCQVAPLLATMSAAAAEHTARASKEYQAMIAQLQLQLLTAEKAISKWEALRCKWDSLRSCLSSSKHIAENV